MASDDEMEIDEEAARELDSDDEFATGLDCEVEDDEIWTRFWSEEKQQRRREMPISVTRIHALHPPSSPTMPSVPSPPTETLLAIIEAATWCPGPWYRLTRPLVYRDFVAALPPRPDIIVDPIDGGNLGRFVQSLRFAPYIKDPPNESIRWLRRRWAFEGEYRGDNEAGEFPHFARFCRMRLANPGAFMSRREAEI
ncbi:hypothetical protein RTG_00552 [Rhodotorula toruloides ATCC 204091]|uniref:Uncharacterized protein n=1 Tax=Rhodotorula toruloides TaxID=5286 RepID=A0A0K3C9N7_RHOTO|nr:hypothetical protein RTG_00552 [Rhodotorula toruloides ATCC 204091]PRQ77194.1 hypothetical protein AAT19DRAFT_12612 [Rhodotorula toruloides]